VKRLAEGLFWHARVAEFDFGQWYVDAEVQGGLDALPNLSAVLKFAEENGLKACA